MKNRKERKRLSTRNKKTRKNRKRNTKKISSKSRKSQSISQSKSKSMDSYVYKTKAHLYNKARNIKRSNNICYEAISRMNKDGVIRFLRKYE